MLKAFLGTLAVISTTLFSSTAAIAGEQDEVVNIYTARHYDTDDRLYEQFTETTGIRVNIIEGKSDELLARIKREGKLSPADVFISVDAGRLWRGEEMDIFAPTSSDLLEARIPENLRHPEGHWFGITKRARVIVLSDRVPIAEQPTSYADLAKPEWKGRVLIRSSSNIYNQSLVASMIEQQGVDATERWARSIVGNMARAPQGGDTDQIRAVVAAEGDVAVVNHYYLARLLSGSDEDRAIGSQVRIIFPDQDGQGTHVNISGAGVLRHAPNPENAVRLIEYLTQDQPQVWLTMGNNEFPVVTGVECSPVLESWGSFTEARVNTSALGRNNAEAVKLMDRAGWR